MPILISWVLLVLYGIAAVYSVSIHESFVYSLKYLDEATNYFYFTRHLWNILFSLIAALIVYKVPLNFFKKYKNVIFVGLLVFQLLVFVPGISLELQWASWWIKIPGYGTIQPSEFFKLWFVVFFAWRLYRKKSILGEKRGYLSYLVFMSLVGLLFLQIPDLGTLLVLAILSVVMYRYAGWRAKHLLLIIASIWIVWLSIWRQIPYIKARLQYFVNPAVDVRNQKIWYQTENALVAVGAWWLLGNGYGKWLQKFWFIPEAQSDFIFAAFSEEMGFLGNLFMLFLFGYIAYVFLRELPNVRDDYTRIFGVGILATIFIQMFVNVGVNIKILPLTWLTLPFISTWGTALMVNFIQLTLLYKIIYKKERIT